MTDSRSACGPSAGDGKREDYRFAMARAIDMSKTVNTASVVTTKNQSLILAYLMTETTTRRTGVAISTINSAVQQPVRNSRIDLDRPQHEAEEEQRGRADHAREEERAELSLEAFECVFIH